MLLIQYQQVKIFGETAFLWPRFIYCKNTKILQAWSWKWRSVILRMWLDLTIFCQSCTCETFAILSTVILTLQQNRCNEILKMWPSEWRSRSLNIWLNFDGIVCMPKRVFVVQLLLSNWKNNKIQKFVFEIDWILTT